MEWKSQIEWEQVGAIGRNAAECCAFLYGAEPCAAMKRQEKRIDVNEMRMLWWIGCME